MYAIAHIRNCRYTLCVNVPYLAVARRAIRSSPSQDILLIYSSLWNTDQSAFFSHCLFSFLIIFWRLFFLLRTLDRFSITFVWLYSIASLRTKVWPFLFQYPTHIKADIYISHCVTRFTNIHVYGVLQAKQDFLDWIKGGYGIERGQSIKSHRL